MGKTSKSWKKRTHKYGIYAIEYAMLIVQICYMRLKKDEVSRLIGRRIREIRKSKGMTIEGLANDAGIEYTQLSRIELGKINTSIYHIYILSSTLSTPIPEIFDGI